MAEVFSSLGKIFTNPATASGGGGGFNWGNLLKTGLGGFGLIGNIMAQNKQNSALNRIDMYQKHPELAAAKISSLTQPLNAGLVSGVGNEVQGYLAERGLSQSPNITAGVLGQQLAPYMQQNQMTAEQLFQNLLNPAGAKYQQPANLSSLFSLFNKPAMTGTGTPAGATPPFFPSTSGGSFPLGQDNTTDSPINWQDAYAGANA